MNYLSAESILLQILQNFFCRLLSHNYIYHRNCFDVNTCHIFPYVRLHVSARELFSHTWVYVIIRKIAVNCHLQRQSDVANTV